MPDDHISPTAYGSLTPEKAFALVGNEIRSEILWALSEARSGKGDLPALSFSELRSCIDADIDNSQFNYHLQQVVGHFVERTEEGDGQLIDRRDGPYADDPGWYLGRSTITRSVRTRS